MEIFVVIVQPDCDWNWVAFFRGAFTTLEKAQEAGKGWKCEFIKTTLDELYSGADDYARTNV